MRGDSISEATRRGPPSRVVEHCGRSVDGNDVRFREHPSQLARANPGAAADVEHAPDGRCLGSAQLDESARSVGDEVQEQLAFELGVRGERSPIGFREAGMPVLVCGHAVTIEPATARAACAESEPISDHLPDTNGVVSRTSA
jgi:hypothetical protein